ncbi:MAG: hypothetical protein RL215_1278 [Planctomycetota bacterium]
MSVLPFVIGVRNVGPAEFAVYVGDGADATVKRWDFHFVRQRTTLGLRSGPGNRFTGRREVDCGRGRGEHNQRRR